MSTDSPWRDLNDVPTDGTKFDAWCVHPNRDTLGCRFTNVLMRGDESGFGWVYHTEKGAQWQYINKAGNVFPEWKLKYWMPIPSAPNDAVMSTSQLSLDFNSHSG